MDMQSNCSIFIQDADVAARNAAVSQVLSEPRISPLGQLSIAEWDEVKGGALVRKKTGKYWESFGHTEFGVSEETFKFKFKFQSSILEVVISFITSLTTMTRQPRR